MRFSVRVPVSAIVLALTAVPAVADDIDLAKGSMTYEDYGDNLQLTKQLLKIQNHTLGTITVVVECDFWREDKLLDGGKSLTIGNVKPGQSGTDVLTGKGRAERATCHVTQATKVDRRGDSTEIIKAK